MTELATPTTPTSPPRQTQYAVAALATAGVLGVVGALAQTASSTKTWLAAETHKADLKSKDVTSGKKSARTMDEIHKAINDSSGPLLIESVVLLVLMGFIGYSMWKGKHWTRWAVVGVFALLSLMSPVGGINGLFLGSSSAPAVFKVPALLASLTLLAAVVLVFLKPTKEYLALSRPVRATRGGDPGISGQRAGGLFGPRPNRFDPGSARRKPATVRPADERGVERRTRARAKSRRVETDNESN